jgi:hypothetical protein
MLLQNFLNKIGKVLSLSSNIAPTIPFPLIMLSASRPGMSYTSVALRVLAKKKELGLAVGNYDDGTANHNDLIILEIVKQVIAEIQEKAKVTVVIPPGTQVIASGGNAGGPVVAYGTTITPTTGFAIVQ